MKNTFTMQKYIAVALATAMLGSMGVTAFASPVQVSPVKAVSTRMSSSTAAAQEKLKKAEEELPEVDAVIVTAVYEYDEIEKMLADRVSCPVISLEEILYEG